MMDSDSDSSLSSSAKSDLNSLSNYLPSSTVKRDSLRDQGRRIVTTERQILDNLKETHNTLEDVDEMIGDFNSIARTQAKSIEKLKRRMGRESKKSANSSRHSLSSSDSDGSRGHHTYRTTSPLRNYQYASDSEYVSSRRRPRSAVRFREAVNVDKDHLHQIHRSLRDLSADHERLESELDREIRGRYRTEKEHEKSMRDLNNSLRQSVPYTSSQPRSSIENIEKRLERKLESMATKLERNQQKENSQPVITAATLSKSLTEAIQATQRPVPPPAASLPNNIIADLGLQNRVADLESDKRRLMSEMDSWRQKYEQSEGARLVLTNQLDEIRSHLRDLDDEKHKALRVAEEYRDSEKRSRKKQREVIRATEDEHHKLQMEIQDLKVQLAHSISREEMEIMRRELQKSEKQRVQMTEHIETITKDVKQKDQLISALQSQHGDYISSKTKLEAELSQVLSEQERLKVTHKESTQQVQKLSSEVSDLKTELSMSEKRKEEMRNKATEVVKLWKSKCKGLQKELEECKSSEFNQGNKNQQLAKENEVIRNQLSSANSQLDRLAQDMADLLTSKQDVDERNRRYELELKDLHRANTELEHKNHENSLNIQKLERDIRKANDQFINYEAESAQLADKLSEAKNQVEHYENASRQLKSELSSTQAEISQKHQQLSDKEGIIQDLEARLLTTDASESACRRELDNVHVKLSKLQESHEKISSDLISKIEKLKKENADVKARELKTADEYLRRFKHLQAEKDAELEAMRLDLDNAHTSIQSIKRQAKTQTDDFLALEHKYKLVDEEFSRHKQQYERQKEQVDSMTESRDHLLEKYKEKEMESAQCQQRLYRLEQQYSAVCQTIRSELNTLVETAESNSDVKYDLKLKSDDIIPEITSLSTWLRRIIRTAHDQERQLRAEIKTSLSKEDSEKRELIAEIKRTRESMDELSQRHKELLEDSVIRDREVAKLEDKVNELSYQLDEQIATDDMAERNKILERYSRLQSAVNALKYELSSHSSQAQRITNQNSAEYPSSKSASRQVRISDVVNNDDGTQSELKRPSSTLEENSCESTRSNLEERIEAYNRALGPASYKTTNFDDVQEMQGKYLNDINEENSSSFRSSTNSNPRRNHQRHFSLPKKTLNA